MNVTLSWYETEMAGAVGLRRFTQALRDNRQDKHGLEQENALLVHINGAGGEQAVAKVLNRYWPGTVDTYRSQGDLGPYEVKTRSKHHYDLLVREDDDPQRAFILVTGVIPTYRVRGWMWGYEAKRDGWLQNHGGRGWAWFVPADCLRSLDQVAAAA